MMEFTVLKTRIFVSPMFFAVITVFLLIDRNGIACEVVLFSLLHETGHFLALLGVKSSPKLIAVSVFGIEMELPVNLSTTKKCIVLMAGFTLNFILAAMLFVWGEDVSAYINLIIGIITAMPLAATDGGAILKTLLEEYFPQKAGSCFKNISFSFLVLIAVFIVFSVLVTHNYFLLFPLIYMVLCTIKTAA